MAGRSDIAKFIDELRYLKNTIFAGKPYFIPVAYALDKFIPNRVVIESDPGATAATDSRYLYVNPDFFAGLTTEEKKFVLAHEAFHYMVADPEFTKRVKYPKLFNIAADVVINRSLKTEFNVRNDFYSNLMNPENVHSLAMKLAEMAGVPGTKVPDVDWFRNASRWEIYNVLAGLVEKVKDRIRECRGRCGDIEKELKDIIERAVGRPLSGDVKRSPYSVEEGEARKDRYRAIYDEVKRSFKKKMRGTGAPTPFERIFEASKMGIDWRRYLKNVIAHVASMYVSTWKRPSRRHPSYPGYQKFGLPEVVVLVDVSGSIGDEELAKFMGELWEMLTTFRVQGMTIIYWTTEVVRVAKVRSRSDLEREIEIAKHLSTGGTTFASGLREAMKYARPDRVVVTFSDGFIEEDRETYTLSEVVGMRYAKAVFVTTANKPRSVASPPWVFVEYIIGEQD